jgi:hypothetical protein
VTELMKNPFEFEVLLHGYGLVKATTGT